MLVFLQGYDHLNKPKFMTKYLSFFLLILLSSQSFSQSHPTNYFQPPLDIPLILSGTFGELRSNHFHAGIDIKTQGASGLKVYAIADGYVSRIKVSPYGYGKAIYITHPNGYTSVYAHLMRYNDKINEFVKKSQYNKESYAIELFPKEEQFIVEKGDIIALSGNSGSSMAPHLHFEIRETATEFPQNGLHFGFDIKDDIPPIIGEIKIYNKTSDISEDFIRKVKGVKGKYYIKEPISVTSEIALGINTYDILNKARNKNGVYIIKLFVDSQMVYSHKMDEFGFHQTRYINSHLDYSDKISKNKKIHKCYLDPNNQLPIYYNLKDDGIIKLPKDSLVNAYFVVKDVYHNESKVDFKLINNRVTFKDTIKNKNVVSVFKYAWPGRFENSNVKLRYQKNSFYKNIEFEYQQELDTCQTCLSPTYKIHKNTTPVHKKLSISIKCNISDSLQSKSFIAEVNKNGNLIYKGGKFANGFVETKIKNFGNYTVSLDTLPPVIKGLNIYPGKQIKSSSLKMSIKDGMSGVKNYTAKIDGKWILMEYDPKNSRLTHYYDKNLTKGEHIFNLEVVDNKDNLKTYEAKFYY